MLILYVFFGFLLYLFIGCCVMGLLDRDQAILNWLQKCPYVIVSVIIFLLWPVLAILTILNSKRQKNEA